MGLDMYIRDSDGKEIAYWRKHNSLHRYIVNTFARGIDDCKEIYLRELDIVDIMSAVADNNLPEIPYGYTEEYPEGTLILLSEVLVKLMLNRKNPNYKIYYEASW